VREVTAMPLAIGFGVSRPEHVAEIGRFADAAVVGSALVAMIADASAADRGKGARAGDTLESRVTEYVRWLTGRA
jgi:tryptophan synthase alpha chain